MPKKMYQKLIWLVGFLIVLSATTACQSEPSGPGMILSFGSVIDGQRIYVKSAKLPNGQALSNPGSVGGSGTRKWRSWRNVPTKVEGTSGDSRGLPEWADFEWQELEYPGLQLTDFASDEAFSKHVREEFSKLQIKTQRLEIKSRIPQEVVDEVIESNRKTPKGQLPEKTLWLYIFWTPDGIKMRWELNDDKDHREGGFGHAIKEGGDDLDRYNQ